MRKIHVVPQKETIDPEKITDCVAVVYDVFLATSTILFLLEKNYGPVTAVENEAAARAFSASAQTPAVMIGESDGDPIEDFLYPDPQQIGPAESGERAVFCSTNGTRALEKAKGAKELLIGSLLNGRSLAAYIAEETESDSIVIVAAGNAGRLSVEDMVGGGHLIDELLRLDEFELSDAAVIAHRLYIESASANHRDLLDVETFHLLEAKGFPDAAEYVIRHKDEVPMIAKYSEEERGIVKLRKGVFP
ncbi:2-phosphosulfolactate phosphatase [Bhargavaea ginsengi]|uniref:2-phosphosulfolactate phosphatase n=1 Tax=Bhargavaea ginsengi TaxID=426757 RepID=UPI002040E95A|nr:2-phosphosulfolactate phosphatase [Bhargavaea ginsengi]MCM3087941.1 2-phosphosulfolactate phosphatase [Bhargavaea ginsengi]